MIQIVKLLSALFLLAAVTLPCLGEDFASLCADRTAVERVYYNHRIGEKPPFEQAVPRELIERLVREDMHKEAVLKKVYDVEITPAIVSAEVQRIDATTRAPDVLAELKAALGNDTNRFAQTVARPIVIERILRNKFENDDPLHVAQRRQTENARDALLAAKNKNESVTNLVALLKQYHANQVSEVTWQLAAHPAETNASSADEIEIKKKFGPGAQIISSPHQSGAEQKFYFDDLPTDLQHVLRLQLRQAGDVSAVIETPGGFSLYLAREKTADQLSVVALAVAKRSYEEWLKEQPEDQNRVK